MPNILSIILNYVILLNRRVTAIIIRIQQNIILCFVYTYVFNASCLLDKYFFYKFTSVFPNQSIDKLEGSLYVY